MAISSYKTYLMKKAAMEEAYTKLVDIIDFPDLGGAPEMLDTTTLSDPMETKIPGIQATDALTFTANYTKDDFTTLKALEDQDIDFAVYFGDEGAMGKYGFKGRLSVFITGAGVNEVVKMTITIAASTPIEPII